MKRELIGCIADDFTGAADVCSFLIDSGANCIIVNDIDKIKEDAVVNEVEVIVVALKIRTIPVEDALKQVKKTISWFEKIGVTRIYDKYCSTFDSSEKGNIGPILDCLIEYYGQEYTLVSPALPENKREVFNGYLFADSILLSEGSMKNHPLTPMTDSYIPRLLEKQSKYKSYRLKYSFLEEAKENIIEYINDLTEDRHFYIIPDYINDHHGVKLAKTFGDLKILSGSSSLINEWYKYLYPDKKDMESQEFSRDHSPTLLLSGSLSQQTTKQVNDYINGGGNAFRVTQDSIKRENREKIYKLLDELDEDLLFYSSREEKFELDDNNSIPEEIESFFSDLAKYAVDNGLKKIIVAGGETSGAVVSKLAYNLFIAEKNITPGVPILRPVKNENIQIVLKSGNFGDDGFFKRSIQLMGV